LHGDLFQSVVQKASLNTSNHNRGDRMILQPQTVLFNVFKQ